MDEVGNGACTVPMTTPIDWRLSVRQSGSVLLLTFLRDGEAILGLRDLMLHPHQRCDLKNGYQAVLKSELIGDVAILPLGNDLQFAIGGTPICEISSAMWMLAIAQVSGRPVGIAA